MAWPALPKSSDHESYDVIIIGAGISGINAAYRLQERNPNLSYKILEGRHEIGGTWSLFNYPGIRSDSDLYTFGFPWRPWTDRASIAQGGLIKNYVKESARVYKIDEKIQYNTWIDSAAWSTPDKTWTLQAKVDKKTDATYKARFIFFCTGYYNYHEPLKADIPGIDNFKGTVIHPQFWPENLDYADKDVVIIGSGATAITVLPAMADKARHVTMLQRSPSYVMAIPREDPIEKMIRFFWWWAPPVQAWLLRTKWLIAPLILTSFAARYPEALRKISHRQMERLLPKSIPRDPHFTPAYKPWEQRMCMCPDGDFFAALRAGKCDVETGHIESVTEKSIKLKSGKELNPDIIVTATGLKLIFAGGMKLTVDGQAFDIPSKYLWKGVMLEDLPNAAFYIGYVDASWTLGADSTAQMMCRLMNTMAKEGVTEVVPRRSAEDKASVQETDLLRLNSTYVTKSKSIIPKAGDRGQWLPRSYYFKDIMNAWYGDLKTSAEWIR